MTAKQKVAKKQDPMVDVSTEPTHYAVQCEDIRLISSSLTPVINKSVAKKSAQYAFRIRAIVEEKKAYSYLEVMANHAINNHQDQVAGFNLAFVLMGTFSTKQNITPEQLGDFIKMYTVTILWPYAREYSTDQFRRAGGHEVVLPIINPQVVTEHIIENDLVEVRIVRKKKLKK
jgi:preprotein translocase subunit SecB